jgi:sulfide:quinone oxidoreductase
MTTQPSPSPTRPLRVAIAGGGIAALEALLALSADAGSLLDMTVVADADAFFYRSLQVGEPFGLGHPHRYPLAELVEAVGARFVRALVAGVQPEEHELVLENGDRIGYDLLLLALGARSVPAFDHGTVFEPKSYDEVLRDLRDNLADDVTVVVPDGVLWSLPAYELALMTAAFGQAAGARVRIVTGEESPLAIFGREASEAVADRLAEAGVTVTTGVVPDVPQDGLVHTGAHWLPTARIVSLPIPVGPRLRGVPCTEAGYLDCDQHGRLRSVPDVWAAGDGTAQPIKQGGLAAQQADAAAADIARRAGASTRPRPFRPVLRGLLRTQSGPLYLRRALGGEGFGPTVSAEPLWWPPSKVASRRLTAHLVRRDIALAAAPRRLATGGIVLSAPN